jgi:hypothetical protein
MELMYVKALKENDLKVSSLPEDAQVGINEIRKVIAGFDMAERKGRKPTPSAVKKLKAMDKWVYYEILDFVHDTENNDDDMPNDADDVLDDLQQKTPAEKTGTEADPIGLKIDSELDQLFASGKKEYTIDDIKRLARTTYKEIWDAYESDETNGIETSKYSFIENENELFILKLK